MGIMGVFLGPVILAVTFDLLKEWVEMGEERDSETAYGVSDSSATGGVGRKTGH
jgi:predicted PurR-regulated permease PerM